MSVDEARLIQQAKKGHLTAFAEIYDRYQPAIYRYLLYQVGDAATAEHLTSEVFISLVGSIDRFPHHSLPDNRHPACFPQSAPLGWSEVSVRRWISACCPWRRSRLLWKRAA